MAGHQPSEKMMICQTCGNEIRDDAWKCPHCETPQYGSPDRPARRSPKVITLNLESGLPSVEDSLERLDRELDSASAAGARVMRIVHGYGSTGSGGKIRQAVRRHLARHASRLGVRRFILGEQYSEDTVAGRETLASHPVLRKSLRTDRLNPGITLVLM